MGVGKSHNCTWLPFHYDSLLETYSESSQTSKMIPFAKKLKSSNSFMRLHCIKSFRFWNYSAIILSTLYKKWSFPLRISSVNKTKSAVSCWFFQIYWRNPSWKTSFFLCSIRHYIKAIIILNQLKIFIASIIYVSNNMFQIFLAFRRITKGKKIGLTYSVLQWYKYKIKNKLSFVKSNKHTLRKNCLYLELFWFVFSCIWTEYGTENLEIRTIFTQW